MSLVEVGLTCAVQEVQGGSVAASAGVLVGVLGRVSIVYPRGLPVLPRAIHWPPASLAGLGGRLSRCQRFRCAP